MSGRRIGGRFGMFVGAIPSLGRFWLLLGLVRCELDGIVESLAFSLVDFYVAIKLITVSLLRLFVIIMDRSRSNHLGRKRGRVQKSGDAGAKRARIFRYQCCKCSIWGG